jgi:hypothetical protein
LAAYYRLGAQRWHWVVVAFVVLIAVTILASTVPLLIGAVADLVVLLALVAVLAAIATTQAIIALHGSAPVFTLDEEQLNLHLPFNRARVRLDSITKVTQLRRDLLIEAAGGIERHGRITRARWVPIDGASSLTVDRAALAEFIRRRAGLTG